MLGRLFSLPAIGIDFIRAYFGTRHEQTEETMDRVDASRQKNWKMLSSKFDEGVFDHVKAFGDYIDGNYEVNPEVMYTVLVRDAKLTPKEARALVSASMSLPYMKGLGDVEGGCPGLKGKFSPYDAPALLHPHDSGFYNKDGTFNYTRFKHTIHFAIKDKDGKRVISLAGMRKCLASLAENDHRWDDADFIENAFGKLGNTGEYDTLFKITETRWVNVNGTFVAHAVLTDIKRWLTNTLSVLKDKREGRMQLPPPPNLMKILTTSPHISSGTTRTDSATDAPQPDLLDKAIGYICRFAADHYVPGYGPQSSAFFKDGTQHACIINSSAVPGISPPAPVGMLGR